MLERMCDGGPGVVEPARGQAPGNTGEGHRGLEVGVDGGARFMVVGGGQEGVTTQNQTLSFFSNNIYNIKKKVYSANGSQRYN